jgi:hypothetical protein
MSGLRERIAVWIGGLAPREQLLLGTAAALLVLALVWLGLVRPLVGAVSDATLRVETAERNLEVARRVQGELAALQANLSAVEQRIREGPRGNLFTTLEQLAAQSAVKVESMEPQASSASDAYFRHKIESSPPPLSVMSLRVRTRSDQRGGAKTDLLDVTFTVSSFEPTGGA